VYPFWNLSVSAAEQDGALLTEEGHLSICSIEL
jgi:hypothetical protein